MGSESICGVTKSALGFRCLDADASEDGCPYFEYAIHEGDGSVVRRVVWVDFVGIVYLICGANSPFLSRVTMFGHYMEECIYEVVRCVR